MSGLDFVTIVVVIMVGAALGVRYIKRHNKSETEQFYVHKESEKDNG